MGEIEVADVWIAPAVVLEVADVWITGTPVGGSGHIEVADVWIAGTPQSAVSISASADTLDPGQILNLTAVGGAAPYTWAIVSMTNNVSSPAITASGTSASIKTPATLDGSVMTVSVTPQGGSPVSVTVTIRPAPRRTLVGTATVGVYSEISSSV